MEEYSKVRYEEFKNAKAGSWQGNRIFKKATADEIAPIASQFENSIVEFQISWPIGVSANPPLTKLVNERLWHFRAAEEKIAKVKAENREEAEAHQQCSMERSRD